MKIQDVIDLVDEVKPNAFTSKVKLAWISALEGRLAADVFLLAPVEIAALQYQYPDDLNTELWLRAYRLQYGRTAGRGWEGRSVPERWSRGR